MSKSTGQTKRIVNRRASFDYQLGDLYTVGIALSGAETKALRLGHGQLRGAYVTIKDNELWLVNARINSAPGIQVLDETRSRKLLANKREIEHLAESKQSGKTIVPIELLTGGRFIKLKIAVGQGKKRYDKRETIKRRQQEREALRAKR